VTATRLLLLILAACCIVPVLGMAGLIGTGYEPPPHPLTVEVERLRVQVMDLEERAHRAEMERCPNLGVVKVSAPAGGRP